MKLATIAWNGEEANVKFTEDFSYSDWVLQADAIQDVIKILEDKYNDILRTKNPMTLDALGLKMEDENND
jgi:hypothetical protein